MTKMTPLRRRGFSLVELLVVMGIIALLVGITLPIVSKVRTAARAAATQAFLNQLSGAIERYYQDFHAYPGPLSDNQIYYTTTPPPSPIFAPFTNFNWVDQTANGYDHSVGMDPSRFTGSENLTLGLVGGLSYNGTNLQFDPTLVGKGPISLNPLNPKQYAPYADMSNLFQRQIAGMKTGKYQDDAGAADDTQIPEFTDTFTDPLPILYLRSKQGVTSILPSAAGFGDNFNSVVTNGARVGPYDLSQIKGYVAPFNGSVTYSGSLPVSAGYSSIGVGKNFKAYTDASGNSISVSNKYHGLWQVATYTTPKPPTPTVLPYNAYQYFIDSSQSTPTPHGNNQFILISAGQDRVYGTPDDLTSFGSVGN